MLGDEDAASAKKSTKNIAPEDLHKTFLAKPLWQRALIIFAGPATNYLLAFVLLTGLFWGVGQMVMLPVVGEVMPDSAAQKAGILAGDKILSINDKKVESFTDIARFVRLEEYGKPLQVVILRDNQEQTIDVPPVQETKDSPAII